MHDDKCNFKYFFEENIPFDLNCLSFSVSFLARIVLCILKKIQEMDLHTVTIPEFFAGKNIFITGGTGFLGKVLIDKLLRSCPDIGKIYILVREKKGKSIKERVQYMLKDMLFDTIKAECPGILEKKLIPLAGDCMELGLGLSIENRELIKESVSIIYHVAASVRFDDDLRNAIILNTRGTREAAQLALETKNLSVFVHVSTAYCNCVVSKHLEEKLYPAPADWRKTIEIAERFDSELLPLLAEKFVEPYPNTYTFTKALGEHVVADMCQGRIPTVICRPSIVVSTLRDPVKGWIDNFNGPAGLLVACGKGLMRNCYIDPDITSDFIPVDIITKSFIVASWDLSLRQQKEETEIIQCCSNTYYKWITIGEVIRIGRENCHKYPFDNSLWVPKGFVTKCRIWAYICTILFHLIPSMFMDLGLFISGYKPILIRLQTRIFNAALQLRYFTFQEWQFNNDRFLQLDQRILSSDQKDWSFDFRHENVLEFFLNSMIGARKYLMKEPDENIPQARIHYKRMYWLDKVTMFCMYAFLFWIAFRFEIIDWFFGKLSIWYNDLFSLEGVQL